MHSWSCTASRAPGGIAASWIEQDPEPATSGKPIPICIAVLSLPLRLLAGFVEPPAAHPGILPALHVVLQIGHWLL